MASKPTQRTLAWLRKQGYRCQVVEHWNAFAHRRIDLFGVIDVLAVDTQQGRIIGVQCCSGTDHAKRKAKIEESDAIPDWKEAGGHIWLVSWRKLKPRGTKVAKWEPRIEEL